MKNKITILDSVNCQVSRSLIPTVAKYLKYRDRIPTRKFVVSKNGKRYPKKVFKIVDRYMIDRRRGMMLSGLLHKVKRKLNLAKIKYEIVDNKCFKFDYRANIVLEGVEYRPEQEQILRRFFMRFKKVGRGIIIGPTGIGKTILMMIIIKRLKMSYPNTKGWIDKRILILCHTKDLLSALARNLRQFFPDEEITIIGGGFGKPNLGKINVAIINSFSKYNPKDYVKAIDLIFVDEVHHCREIDSMYGNVLRQIDTPVRIGFTATEPDKKAHKLGMEALIGPVLDQFTLDEGQQTNVLAQAKVELIPVKYTARKGTSNYKKTYEKCIINNMLRNMLAVEKTLELVKEGKTSLLMIKRIEHGKNLIKLFNRKLGKDMGERFLRGKTELKTRELAREMLHQKDIKWVITTTIWKEGVDIPSLDVVNLVDVGKSEQTVLQSIGRGLRKYTNKKGLLIIDYLDPYRYLAEHSIKRITIYKNNGWI